MARNETPPCRALLLPDSRRNGKCTTAGLAVVCALSLGLILPFEAHADSTHSTDSTREQVRSDLDRYRCAGYNPVADEITYPNDIDAARARLQDPGCKPDAAPKQAPRSSKPPK
ncbi:DUF4148 domain-containing protein [Caballeronia sp. AZ10_KS36]|uniref:DUF4148 domain-containing protein n=1 Tax=Caballeronia sp. AZ10_KS36 TaxID=2921757 RepID=UPI0020288A1C|nr:DUF4148 domain-containing protein [Caballeronia sp. AZ10_KS36]